MSTADRDTYRAVSRRIVPILILLYIVAWLDRVNVGFAALQMNDALGFSPAVYGLGAGLFFLGYALFEIPSNILLVRVGARRWIARIAISWGILSAAMSMVHSANGFYVMRFLIGVAEAGLFPGIIYYLGIWFPQEVRAKEIASFSMAMPLASILGGPLAAYLLSHGYFGLAGWRWLFLAEGAPAILLGIIVLLYLPDSPSQARWLKPQQRIDLLAHLQRDRIIQISVKRVSIRQMFTNRLVWVLGIIFFLGSIGSYGLQFWLPLMLKAESNRSDLLVGFLAALPYLPAVVAMRLIGMSSDRFKERVFHTAIPCFIAALGFAAAAWESSLAWSILAFTFAAVGVYGRHGPFWTLPALILDDRAMALGIAFISTIGSVGGFVSPYVVGLIKVRTGGYEGAMLFLSLCLLTSGLLTLRLLMTSVMGSPRVLRPASVE